MIRTVLFV